MLRVVDDFLYITADLGLARAFVRTMACGHGDYGLEVNVDKSRVNFDVQVSVPCSADNAHLSKPDIGTKDAGGGAGGGGGGGGGGKKRRRTRKWWGSRWGRERGCGGGERRADRDVATGSGARDGVVRAAAGCAFVASAP